MVESTIGQTIELLHRSLQDYIEAAYHVSNETLVAQRKALLEEIGVIHQQPYLESTPRYVPGQSFSQIAGLDPAVSEVLSCVTHKSGDLPRLIYDPPFLHQAQAVEKVLVKGKNLVVMTGTGSGKTESFLLPILGKLAMEARHSPSIFREMPAVRALVLYPMNALVNDQLGRLRLLFGDPRIVGKFKAWAHRPARFARYTSRTLYPGVRTASRDQDRLSPLSTYYVHHWKAANNPSSPEHEQSKKLVAVLKEKGKWPAKPNIAEWFGESGSRWQGKDGSYKRCVTLADDPELLTRHEVQGAPPDILVTNYSMLEYMLMRPLERPIFDYTRDWLEANPKERFLLVLDEAHLYRGAAGAEVALLLRRLRTRLNLGPERLQVICTSASFKDPDYAEEFGAQLSGKQKKDFVAVKGDLLSRSPASAGSQKDAVALATVDLNAFYAAEGDARLTHVQELLQYRSQTVAGELSSTLYEALRNFEPMNRLVNITMSEAQPIADLAELIFPKVDPLLASKAVTVLMALGSIARPSPLLPGLLPCRVHAFYRGLPGLWICLDSTCTALLEQWRGGPAGKLYAQPREICDCGARVFELYTCRNCGTAYARAYTDDVDNPQYLWAEAGSVFRTLSGQLSDLTPLDLLLEEPISEDVETAELDLKTGRLNPVNPGNRSRQVYLKKDRSVKPKKEGSDEDPDSSPGEFKPCGVCGQTARFGRSYVQDHQTKGDQPFQALIEKQLQVQPPSPAPATKLAPLRGRKVLIFSDSRQTAARLAPNVQKYSNQDALRPLIVVGFDMVQKQPCIADSLSLEDLYLAVLLSSKNLTVRLRPQLRAGENFAEESIVADAVARGALTNPVLLQKIWGKLRSAAMPESLLSAVIDSFSDRYYGLEALALASLVESPEHASQIPTLPVVPKVGETSEQKHALVCLWLHGWQNLGFWLGKMPAAWWKLEVKPHATGKFTSLRHVLQEKASKSAFEKTWLPSLLDWFCEPVEGHQYRLKGSELSLQIGGEWTYCKVCRTAQRPFPGLQTCRNCGKGQAIPIDPDTDPVFSARKGYYRASTVDALRQPPVSPMALIAAEHTAQISTAQAKDVFSRAEEHELLFQDIDLGPDSAKRERPAIDVLSCTTTMEVGIDIGALSGVALRNMPPARANYQQRSGRAGRRGNAVASVIAFGSADSHDEHYFTHPDQMIRGPVDDPVLTLDNYEIARRHVTAYLLQRYHQERLPELTPDEPQPQLFEVLGKVAAFKNKNSILNKYDFAEWLTENASELQAEVLGWLPTELSPLNRKRMKEKLVPETIEAVSQAIDDADEDKNVSTVAKAETKKGAFEANSTKTEEKAAEGEEVNSELPSESGIEKPGTDPSSENLLDRLLYKGVLPRYAFPTDVATFYVFDVSQSSNYRPVFRFTPSQGLSVALSQYAPGREVWIDGKRYTSGAIYSPIRGETSTAWAKRKLYYECSICHYARTVNRDKGTKSETLDCPACGGEQTLGKSRYWFRPPGFAHPVGLQEGLSPEDQPTRSYATRAKLEAPGDSDSEWKTFNQRVKSQHLKKYLLVTNRGPKQEGYSYCTLCGLIEPTASSVSTVGAPHQKPYFDDKKPDCPGNRATRGMVLGTDFITDILLISLTVEKPLSLFPGLLSTDIALRTLSEALSKAACKILELEPDELQAEYRPALTDSGHHGLEAEIYLYDTLPGGAGFVRQAGDRAEELLATTMEILKNCPENCERSCYRCLRSYKNKLEHDLLDRHIGAGLLQYLLNGKSITLDKTRIDKSTDLLFEDLQRQAPSTLTFERNSTVTAPGFGTVAVPIAARSSGNVDYVIGLTAPLTRDEPADAMLYDLKEYSSIPVLLVEELVVRRNLPFATNSILSSIGDVD